jgi:hypothetical protein
MKVALKKELLNDINELMSRPAPWSVQDIREFQMSVSANHELDVVEEFANEYEVKNVYLGFTFLVDKKEVTEILEDDYIILVKDRDTFIKKYNVKLWNGDKCLCHFLSETDTTITVIGDECGRVEPPIQKTITVDKEDIKAHCHGEPEVIVICIE